MIDVVSDTQRISWDQAQELPVMEFLNTYAYSVAKNNFKQSMQKREYEKIKARARSRRR